jgi:BirA family biotin operon repressor/biotin-[acetyl-CoA-carboxylase] ligase
MHPEHELPVLPGVYELTILEQVDDVLEEAARRAERGEDEGTLVWAGSQRAARTRRGHRWEAPPGNLHCALVLRPDYDNRTAEQLCAVAGVAAGAAVAEVVAPMTGMGLRWPGDVLVNELLAGCVRLKTPAGAGDPWPWLAVALSLNVAHHPENPEPERYNSIHASGDADDVRVVDVLEQFARHFLRWINIWADEGFAPVRAAWRQRARDIGETRELALGERRLRGRVLGIGEHGELVLDTGTGRDEHVRVADYFALSRSARVPR